LIDYPRRVKTDETPQGARPVETTLLEDDNSLRIADAIIEVTPGSEDDVGLGQNPFRLARGLNVPQFHDRTAERVSVVTALRIRFYPERLHRLRERAVLYRLIDFPRDAVNSIDALKTRRKAASFVQHRARRVR